MSALAAILATALAQTPPPPAAETIDLDIPERRIHEQDYHAATELRVEPNQGVRVQVGAGLSARAIDVLLRNVRGSVRFRFDTSRLERLGNPETHQP
jgi:hypothetical protein